MFIPFNKLKQGIEVLEFFNKKILFDLFLIFICFGINEIRCYGKKNDQL